MRLTSFATVLALAPAMFAQEPPAGGVSPSWALVHEAGSANAIPFGVGPCRYQQVHGDLRGSARTLRAIALRQDGGAPGRANSARQLELEVWIGAADRATTGSTFLANYRGERTLVLTRRTIAIPAAPPAPFALPAPFAVELLFDTPWLHSGALDLAWEVVVHSASLATPWYADAMTGLGYDLLVVGAAESLGSGCATPNGVLSLSSTIAVSGSTRSGSWRFAVEGAPSSARGALLLGREGSATPVPALCGGGLVLIGQESAALPLWLDALGSGALATGSLPHDPAWTGQRLCSQAIALDPARSPLPVVTSQAVLATVPPLVSEVLLTRLWAFSPTATSGGLGVGEGLVVRFSL